MKARKPNETDSAVRPGAVTSTFSPFTSPAPSTTRVDQTYHLSPLKELQTPTVAPDTLGSASFGGSTLRVRDATKALRLAQIRDEWIEQLRRLLAKHLMSIMEM